MKTYKIDIPEKIFGIDSALLGLFLPPLGMILLMIFSINLLFVPRIDDYRQAAIKVTNLEKQTKDLDEKRKYLMSVNQDELKKNSENITNALLPQKNSYVLVGVVRKIADSFGFQIDSFMVNPGKITGEETDPKKVKGVSKLPINLTVVGPKDNYLQLIKGLENTLPILSLQSFEMSRVGELTKIDLIVTAYYVDDAANVDISKLTLSDLALKKEESDLLTKLSTFSVLDNGGMETEFDTSKQYTKYDRKDPFNL